MAFLTSAPNFAAHLAGDGEVWRIDRGHMPRATGLNSVDFLASLPELDFARVLDDPANFELLRLLGRRSLQGPGCRLELGRPHLGAWASTTRSRSAKNVDETKAVHRVAEVLDAIDMTVGRGPASLGGWRPYTDADRCRSDVDQAMFAGDLVQMVAAVQQHPFAAALSFLEPIDWVAVGGLMSVIGDPRYFVDPEHSGRDSRLRAYLGLSEVTMARQGNKAMRASLVLSAWKGTYDSQAEQRPGGFVHRYYQALCQSGSTVVAELRATRRFLEFFNLVWLDAVSHRGSSRVTGFHGPFSPTHFFDDEPATARAFMEANPGA